MRNANQISQKMVGSKIAYYKKLKTMTLKDYYNTLTIKEKVVFRDKIIKRTGRHVATFYNWLNDKQRPSFNDQKTIARMAGISVREMFPPKKK